MMAAGQWGLAGIFPLVLGTGILVVLVSLSVGIWYRSKRVRKQRRRAQALDTLAEDVIASANPAEIAEKLSTALPDVSSATSVNLYLYNRRTRSLERVPTKAEPDPMAASLENPPEGLASAAATCFRNGTLLSVPDVRRNPLIKTGPGVSSMTSLPKSAMFVPVSGRASSASPAGSEVLGILEIHNADAVGYFPPEEQASAQHLANLIAAALKLQEQQTMREQLFRSEKLAATGQLISGVASELRTPIEDILQSVKALAANGRPSNAQSGDVLRLLDEAKRASEIVERLVSFTGLEEAAPKHADVNALLASLVRFREPEWKGLGLRTHNRVSPETAIVTAAQGQIEQVLLNLIVHAEQRSAASEAKTLGVHSSVIAGRVVVEIGYAVPPQPGGEETEANPLIEGRAAEARGGDGRATEARGAPAGRGMGLAVCQGIVQGHGGEIRFFSWLGAARFEVDLPIEEAYAAPTRREEKNAPMRQLTLMLVEPEPASQRQLLHIMGLLGHRAVPVNPDEAADLLQRFRFDAVLWAVRSAGARWGDIRERAGASIQSFVLMSDGYDRDLARSLQESGGYLLSRPVSEADLDRILGEIAERVAVHE